MSARAGISTRIAEYKPDRVIAIGPAYLEVGPRNEASLIIPNQLFTLFTLSRLQRMGLSCIHDQTLL